MSGALFGTNMARMLSANLIAGARDGARPGTQPTQPPRAATPQGGPKCEHSIDDHSPQRNQRNKRGGFPLSRGEVRF